MDWQAKWIWAESHTDTPNFYMYARREVDLPNVSSAKCFITCSTEYKLYVNGRYIGRGPNPCHPSFQYYDEHDLSQALRSGKNVVAAVCYNYGVGTHCRPQAPGGFLLQAEVLNGDDEPITIGTDETWKVKPGDEWDLNSTQMFWTIGFQEIYDSRKKPVGWNVVGFDDSGWQSPQVLGEMGIKPWTSLVPRQIPLLREWEVFPERVMECGYIERVDNPALDVATRMYSEQTKPDSSIIKYPKAMLTAYDDTAVIDPGVDKYIVLDFGQEVVGFPNIRIRSGGCGIVDIGYSEALDKNGRVYPTRQNILQADRLILHGGRQEWQTFGRRAFRYMQLTFRDCSAPVEIDSVSLMRIGYPVEQVSSFECSDDLLNRIWQTGIYTLTIGMQDHYEDCPLREHGQYPGDVRVQALQNYYCFFDTALVAKALWQFVQCQREDGLFNALWPSSTNHILPDYNLVWVVMLHDYYLYTGDKSLVEQLYPNMSLLLENWVRTQESEADLLTWEPNPEVPLHEWWLFIDHVPMDKRGEVAAYNAFYYLALRDAAKLAQYLNHHDDAAAWHKRAQSVFDAFNRRLWNDEKGVYIDCFADGEQSDVVSVQTNTLAVLFGLSDTERSERIKRFLLSDEPRVESSGPYFDFYVLQAMSRLGLEEEALDLIRSSWGEMLRRGATTWWETFDPKWAEDEICPHSLCHPWSGAPTYYLPAEVLGVKPSSPTTPVVIIQPHPGDLDWAKGQIKTRYDVVEVEWHSSPGLFTIEINAPKGFVVALPVAGFANPTIEEIDLTPDTPTRKARKTFGWGTTIWRDGLEHDPYLDWLDSQHEVPPEHYKPKKRMSVEDSYIWVWQSASYHVRYEVRESNE